MLMTQIKLCVTRNFRASKSTTFHILNLVRHSKKIVINK